MDVDVFASDPVPDDVRGGCRWRWNMRVEVVLCCKLVTNGVIYGAVELLGEATALAVRCGERNRRETATKSPPCDAAWAPSLPLRRRREPAAN